MPFLQSLFCLKGFDDRNRFFSISITTLLIFILLTTIFSGYLALNFLVLFILTSVLTCSTKRRLHDAQLTKNWQLVPGGLFLLTGTLSLIIGTTSSFYLLILPLLCSALLLTYPSKTKTPKTAFILGYYGPVDLSIYKQAPMIEKPHSERIEPTLINDTNSDNFTIHSHTTSNNIPPSYQPAYESASTQADIGELIRLKFLTNRRFQIGITATVIIIILAVIINSMMNSAENLIANPEQTSQLADEKTQIPSRSNENSLILTKDHLLQMPDNFNLYLSEYRGVIVQWQADKVSNGELWSLASAKGDRSCQSMTFNKGNSIRPINVLVEKSNEYFATFSPLDSQTLIKALAFRSKFSLCGYSFSLKGTQALLGKHNEYASFLETDG